MTIDQKIKMATRAINTVFNHQPATLEDAEYNLGVLRDKIDSLIAAIEKDMRRHDREMQKDSD